MVCIIRANNLKNVILPISGHIITSLERKLKRVYRTFLMFNKATTQYLPKARKCRYFPLKDKQSSTLLCDMDDMISL